jgi:hypothetical protein
VVGAFWRGDQDLHPTFGHELARIDLVDARAVMLGPRMIRAMDVDCSFPMVDGDETDISNAEVLAGEGETFRESASTTEEICGND